MLHLSNWVAIPSWLSVSLKWKPPRIKHSMLKWKKEQARAKKIALFHNVYAKVYCLSWVEYNSTQDNQWTNCWKNILPWQLQMFSCSWAHLFHREPYTSRLFWLILNLFFWGAKGKGIIYLFVCLSFLTSTKQSQTDGWLCCLLSHSLTWMNIKANAQKRWNLIMCHLYGFCVTEEKRWNTFRRIIALVNNGRLPVLHSIMERTGSGPFHQGEINKRTVEPEETHIPGKWVLYEED